MQGPSSIMLWQMIRSEETHCQLAVLDDAFDDQ
jgi:hypothetical protein